MLSDFHFLQVFQMHCNHYLVSSFYGFVTVKNTAIMLLVCYM